MKTVGPLYSGKLNVRWDEKGMGTQYERANEALQMRNLQQQIGSFLKLLNHFLTLDLVVLIDKHTRWNWIIPAVEKRLREELGKVDVEINQEKTKIANLEKGERFSFLGFDVCEKKNWKGKRVVVSNPRGKAKASLKLKIREIFKSNESQPVGKVIEKINPILRGWTNYFRIGNSAECFGTIRDWVEKKVRRHMMRSRKRKGFGWKRWSKEWIYRNLKLFNGYKIRYFSE